MCIPAPWIVHAIRRNLQILPQQVLCFLRFFFLQDQPHRTVKFSPRVPGAQAFPGLRHRQQPLRLPALQRVVSDIVDQLPSFRAPLQGSSQFHLARSQLSFPPPALPGVSQSYSISPSLAEKFFPARCPASSNSLRVFFASGSAENIEACSAFSPYVRPSHS